MKLHDLHGQEFELKIQGYQFPNIIIDKWDSNWLSLQIIVNSKEGSWKTVDPFLLTWELESLCEWFEKIASNENVKASIGAEDFIEPLIKFEIIRISDKDLTLRIYFEGELLPPWRNKGYVGEYDFFIELDLKIEHLLKAIKSLKKEMLNFPQRGK